MLPRVTDVLAMNFGLCSQFRTMSLKCRITSALTAALIVLVISLIIAPPNLGARALRAIRCTCICTTIDPPCPLCAGCHDLGQELEPVPYVHLAVRPLAAEGIALPGEFTRPFPHSRGAACILNV